MSEPADGASRKGPLAGLRVVEFEGIGPAPFAAMLLADLGADIVRIERPGRDAPQQSFLTRGREALVLDLKNGSDREKALALLGAADVLIEGLRPGVMERLGLGPDEVLRRNPRIVYGRMTGWGQTGPLSSSAGHDLNYIAITGVLDGIRRKGDKPAVPLNVIGDFGGGSMVLVTDGLMHGFVRLHNHVDVADEAIGWLAERIATACREQGRCS